MQAEHLPADRFVQRPARAKLNLYLHVTGRRADGFHLLESLVAFAGIGDTVAARQATGLSLTVEGPFAGPLQAAPAHDNLIWRAADALRALAAQRGLDVGGAMLALDKHLPIASGIGGGSADAAAALHALKTLWCLDVTLEDLKKIGASLGSDIPACIAGTPALMRGIGDILDPVPPLPRVPLVLLNPGVAMPTPPVYKAFAASGALTTTPRPAPTGPFAATRDVVAALAAATNDLEAPAISLCPAIRTCLDSLVEEGALLARMSGSGATCFGIFASEQAAADASARLFNRHRGWWVAPTALAAN